MKQAKVVIAISAFYFLTQGIYYKITEQTVMSYHESSIGMKHSFVISGDILLFFSMVFFGLRMLVETLDRQSSRS